MKTLLLMSIIVLGLPAFGSAQDTRNAVSKIRCSIHSAAGTKALENGQAKTESEYALLRLLKQEVGSFDMTSEARLEIQSSGEFDATVSTIGQGATISSNTASGNIESLYSDLYMLSVSNGHDRGSIPIVVDSFTSIRCKLK